MWSVTLKSESNRFWWVEGLGWTYMADEEAIKSAQEALDEFLKEQDISALEKERDEVIKALDDQTDAWQKYKDSWKDVASDYETEQERIILSQQLGANAENDILKQRIEAIQNYKNKYIATMKEIDALDKGSDASVTKNALNIPSSGSTAGASAGSQGSSSSVPSLTKGSAVQVKSGTRWYANSSGGGASGVARGGTIKYVNEGSSHPYNIDGLGWVKKSDIVGYSNGGIVDYTGLAMLHGSKNNPEYVFNNDQMKKFANMILRPELASGGQGGNTINNYNFGNVELPNVTNANQFINELKSLVNITKH